MKNARFEKSYANVLWFALALGCGVVGYKAGARATTIPTGPPAKGLLLLTSHDAAGRTATAKATYNTFAANGTSLVIDFTSDQILCSAFQ